MNGKMMAEHLLSAIKSHVGGVVEMLRAEIATQIKAVPVIPGPQGEKGLVGERGEPGPIGEKGLDGVNGKDGAPGLNGKDGVNGANGVDGTEGKPGEKGEPGAAGRDGKDGADGKDGRDGLDGKDALDIEPVTNLEKSRSYSRGTWATYKGSLIRAMRTTDAIKDAHPAECGWAVMVEGNYFENMTVEHDGKRGVTFKWIKGGYEESATIQIPCVLDAGFYKEGMQLEKGDGVTFGGSYWIAQKDTNTKPEIGNPDWRLSVKKGRDSR